MTTVFAEPVQTSTPVRRRRRRAWVLRGVGAALLAGLIVVANLWAAYQPLVFGGLSGGGDGRLGADNPFHPPAVMVIGTKGHQTQLAVSLRNAGRFDVTIDRVTFPMGGLRNVSVDWADRTPGQPVHFPDKIPAHAEHEYSFTVRVTQCFDAGGYSGFQKIHVFFHALGDAHSAWIPTPGGIAITGPKGSTCPS